MRYAIICCLTAGFLLAPAGAQETSMPSNVVVEMVTSMGTVQIELDAARAPISVANFLAYVDAGHYAGTIFHRVIDGFMIQGGGYDRDLQHKGALPPIQNEADNGLRNLRGTVAMARLSDPNTASSQFFINTVDNAFLDHTAKTERGWGYAVFGRVISGMDVVDAIAKVRTESRGGMKDVPVAPVFIGKVTRVEPQP